MKSDKRLSVGLSLPLAAVAGLLVLMFPAAGAQSEDSAAYGQLQKGKEVFLEECRKCHTIKYALAESYSRDDWSLTVNMMVSNGAQLSDEQKSLIIDYLSAKTAFETKCNVCHSLERPLSRTKTPEEWRSTVNRMAGKRQGHLSAEEIEVIAAFLALGYPKPDK